jgi:hypothetical protein
VTRKASLWKLPGGQTRIRGKSRDDHERVAFPVTNRISQSNYFVDLSSAEALGLRSERAWHGIIGLERTFGGLGARAEGYYKRFDRLIVGRLETPNELATRVAIHDFPPDLHDQLPRAPEITSIPGNDGKGRAYGVEWYLARGAISPRDRVINLLNRDNAGNLSTELVYDPTSDRPRVTTTRDESLPLLPSFGVRLRF